MAGYISTSFPLPDVQPYQPDNGAADVVRDVMADAETLAASAQTRALAAIEELGDFAVAIPPVSVPDIPIQTVTAAPLGTIPTAPADLSTAFPPAPVEPALGTLASVAIGDEPVFDIAAPLLAALPLPDPFDALLPAAPELAGATIPAEPDYRLPDVPALLALNLPDAPVLDLPLFDATLGDLPAAPAASFAWSEVDYDTALLTAMNTRLFDCVQGTSTGLAPEVEAAIWNRGRDRAAILTQRAVDEANRLFAARGFALPTGTLLRVVQQALADGIARDADLNRDILIKQAELEQSNFQFAFNAAVALEGQLIGHFNQVQARALDAAKFQFQALIQIFNAQVSLFQADVQAFGMKASVFKTRLEGALAQLDVYKAQLQGQQLIGQLNEQAARIYEAQLSGVKVAAEIFRERVSAAKLRIDADAAQVEIYRAQLQGYDSLVKAKAAEYDGYASQVKAELTKVQMFGEQVAAFKSRTDAFAALVQARLGVADLDFKQTQQFPVELHKSRVAAYQVAVQAEAERLRAVANVFDTQVRAFAASEQAKAANTGAQVEAVKATTGVYVSQAQLALQAGESNVRLAMSAAETAQASLRAAGQLSGQLAAAAMSARNVSASISTSASNAVSASVSRSTSASDSFSRSISDADITHHSD